MEALLYDLRFALRNLRQSPAFTAVALATLVVGIGANTAMFSVARQILLRPLPWPDAERLVYIRNEAAGPEAGRVLLAERRAPDRAAGGSPFAALGAFAYGGGNLRLADRARAVNCSALVTPGLLELLGTEPARGRLFTADDYAAGDAAILSHRLWRDAYGGDPGVLGSPLVLDERSYTIVGVLSEGYQLPIDYRWVGRTELVVPLDPEDPPAGSYIFPIARLADGVSAEEAAADLANLSPLAAELAGGEAAWEPRVWTVPRIVVGSVRPIVLALLGTVGLVLLIACANISGLLLARAEGRRHEFALRGALGAGRRRLVRQLLTESLLLALVGGLAGFLLTRWGIRLLLAGWLEQVPRLEAVDVDGQVFAFALVLSSLTTVVFGLAPALQLSRCELRGALAETGRGGRRRPWRDVLAALEVAMAVVLTTGAALLATSVMELYRIDPGFDAEGVLTGDLVLHSARYPDPADVLAFYARAERGFAALPEVESVAFSTAVPFWNGASASALAELEVEGRSGPRPPTAWEVVSPDFFSTLGIRVADGRPLGPGDKAATAPVAVVNQALARWLWGSESAVGRRLRLAGWEEWREVVGVVADVRDQGLVYRAAQQLYLPLAQVPPEHFEPLRYMSLMVRTGIRSAGVSEAVHRTLAELDPGLALANFQSLQDHLLYTVWRFRFSGFLLGLFAVLALVLSAIGIYGIVSHRVAHRRHEIGVRMALGADPAAVVRMMVRGGLVPALWGLGLGLAAAAALTRLLAGVLYGVEPGDPRSFVGGGGVLLAAAWLASYLPALKASAVDPATALREE